MSLPEFPGAPPKPLPKPTVRNPKPLTTPTPDPEVTAAPVSLYRIVQVGELLAQTNPSTLNNTATKAGPSQQTIAGENSLIPLIYGRRRIGARITAVVLYQGDLVLRCVWCMGEIDAIEAIEINDQALPAGVTVTHYLGTAGQTADATLVAAYAAQTPAQAYTDTLAGVAYSVVRISSSAPISGFPRLTATLRGSKVLQASLCYVALNGSTQWASTPDSVATDIDEPFEIEACVALNDWTPATMTTVVSKWTSTGNQRSYLFGVSNTGALVLQVSTNGTAFNTYTSSAAPTFTDGARYWIKVAFAKTNGTNSTATFSTSADGITYTQLGTVIASTIVASIFGGTYETRIGADGGGGGIALAGKVWYARLDTATRRVLDFVPWNQSAGLATWVDDNGNTWTLAGSAVINAAAFAWSRVPADCLADFIRSTVYGPGKRVDLRYLLQAVAWNTEVLTGPPAEARHQLDLALDSSQQVEAWLNVLRDYAHCWVVPEGGTYYLIRDANDAVEGAFTASEIMQDSLQIKKRGARNQPTCVQVTWTDTSQSPWRDVTETVYLPGVLSGAVPRRMSKISKPGITRRSEAVRYAIERLNEATLSDVTIDCTLDDSATKVRVGGIYNFTHPVGFAAKPFRILRARPMLGRYQITANEFDPALYSSTVVTAPTIIDSTLPSPSSPPPVTGLGSVEDVVQTKDGLYVSRIRIDWTEPANFPFSFIRSYRVQIYDNSVPAVLVHAADVTTRPMVTPPLKELVPYTVSVSVVSATGVVSAAASTTLTPQGKYLPPSDVASVSGFEAGGRVFLSWAAAVDLTLDTIRYEIRYGATSSTWDTAVRVDRVSALTYATAGLASGLYRFFVKALDSVGNYSANAAFVDVQVSIDSAAFSAYTYLNQQVEGLAITETAVAGQRFAYTDWGDAMGYGHATTLNTSGTWNDGTVPSSVVATQPHRSAQRFVASLNRYVAVPYVAAQNVGSTFTIEAWVYPTSYDATGRCIFSQSTNNDTGGWHVRLITGGAVYFAGVPGFGIATTNETCPLFKWSHVCVKVSAGTVTVYINGQACTYSSGPNAYTFLNNTNPRWIGAIRTGALFPFDGLIQRTKLWNTALSDANRLISMQYEGDPTSIGGLVGCWAGSDQVEGASSTTYTDTGSGASNGTITPSVEWRSWSEVLAQSIDLGQVINGTFTVSGGDLTALSGPTGPVIRLSADGSTWTTYKQPTVVASARFFKFGYEAQGGSMAVNLTTLRGDVLVTPRTEAGTITCASTGTQSVLLAGLYAKAIDLQLTPAQTPNAWFAVPDQIEVSAKGIAGGIQVAKMGDSGAASWRASRASLSGISTTMTVEAWVRVDATSYIWDLPNDGNTAYCRLVLSFASSAYIEGNTTGAVVFANGSTPTPAPPVGQWTHVAVVANGTAWSLYYDGVLVGTCTFASPASTSTGRTWLLGCIAPSTNALYGRLSDVRVWTTARSQAQIVANYKARVPTDANLKAYWQLGGDLLDASGNSNTLTAGGTAVYRPLNGFDVYLFNNSATRQAGDVRYRWTGA